MTLEQLQKEKEELSGVCESLRGNMPTPANEWREVVDRLEVLADPIAETLPEYERINEFVSLVGKLRPALNQHSARIVERIETLKVDGETPCGHQDLHETEVAYNQALDQVIDIVKDI